VSLSPVNVYACLVCGKYFQARAIGLGYIAAQGSLRRFPTLPLSRSPASGARFRPLPVCDPLLPTTLALPGLTTGTCGSRGWRV